MQHRSAYHLPVYLSLRKTAVAPAPTTQSQKFIHTLPGLLFIPISLAIIFINTVVAVIVHVVCGPVRKSWTLATSVLHSVLKSALITHPPQGRHSLETVRFFTKFSIPSFLFPAVFKTKYLRVSGCQVLGQSVREALKVEGLINYINNVDELAIETEWIYPNTPTYDTRKIILYLHGGAHIFLHPGTHRSVTTRLANVCGCRVVAPDYRLCPENPFPSAIEDALACYLALIGHTSGIYKSIFEDDEFTGVSPSDVVVMGDSSGACLTLQLVHALNRLNLPIPSGIVLISPFLDHEMQGKTWHSNFNHDFLTLDHHGVEWALSIYANGVPLSHPSLSPVKWLSDLKSMPILVQAGECDVVLDDAVCFSSSNSGVRLEVYEDMFHTFHLFPCMSFVEDAFLHIGKFVEQCTEV